MNLLDGRYTWLEEGVSDLRRPRRLGRALEQLGEDQCEALVPSTRSSTEMRSSLTCERPVVPGP